jgi:hypothetical protein
LSFRPPIYPSAPGRGATVAAWLVALLIALYVVAIRAMATKPT